MYFCACGFLLQQLGDHGSGVVQTAWGLLALLAAGCENETAIAKAAAFLIAKQVGGGFTNTTHTLGPYILPLDHFFMF